MSTVIGLDAFKMLLEQRPSQRAVFKTDGNIEGLTTFHSQGHFENSGGKKLISHRVILTDDDIKRVLPHTITSISWVQAEGNLYLSGVIQDRLGAYTTDPQATDPQDPKVYKTVPSIELYAGKIDAKDIERYPATEYTNPEERKNFIMVSAALREMAEEGGLNSATCNSIKVLSISPVLDKDAGFTHATNAQITTLAEIEGPVDRLPASGNLSENEIHQGLKRYILPVQDLPKARDWAAEENLSLDTQFDHAAQTVSVATRTRTNAIEDYCKNITEAVSGSNQSSYTREEVLDLISSSKSKTEEGDPRYPDAWFVRALKDEVDLSDKYHKY